MLSPKTRARATDRDEAVEVIEAAYADGQLSREEYDVRSQRALEALTLGDLRAVVKDLQRPVSGASTSEVVRPKAPSNRLFTVGIALAVGGLVAAWGFSRLVADDVPSTGGAETPIDIMRADGFRKLVAALEARTGDTVIFNASLGEHYGGVTVPADATSDRSVSYTWRDTGFEEGERASTELDGIRVDLKRIDPEGIATNVEAAAALVEEPEDVYLNIEADEEHPRQCYTVTVNNRFGESSWVDATCSGEVLRTDS